MRPQQVAASLGAAKPAATRHLDDLPVSRKPKAQAQLTNDGAAQRLHTKRRPAPTRALRRGIAENKPFADQARVVVECGPLNESIALGVDENAAPFRPFEHVVVGSRSGLPGKYIAEART